jgi:methyl-CpG-binding domain protein 4
MRLIQEDYLDDRWKMVVCCILLNQTTNQQVRKILTPLFDLIPSPEDCLLAETHKISEIIRSTGFHNVKAERIKKMSQKWVDGISNPSELPGVGKYAIESWEIFVNGRTDFVPSDKKLRAYLESLD